MQRYNLLKLNKKVKGLRDYKGIFVQLKLLETKRRYNKMYLLLSGNITF